MTPLPPPSATAFSVPSRLPLLRARALCIHGYTGTPYEVLPVALALADIGVASEGIVLPGHEGDPRALDHITWQDWADAAARAVTSMPRDVPHIVVGSSMGGLLALHLAASGLYDLAGLILLAPALRFHLDGHAVAIAAQRGLWRVKRSIPKERPGGDVSSDEGRAKNPSYRELPVRGIGELGILQRIVDDELHRVTTPVCVVHGAYDHTIPPSASERVARRVASTHVEHHVLGASWHLIGIDVERDRLCSLAMAFAHHVLGKTRRTGGGTT